MFKKDGVLGTVVVATVLCVVCSVLVSAAAVVLAERQEKEKALDRQRNILVACGLCTKKTSREEVESLFNSRLLTKAIEFETGAFDEAFDVAGYEQAQAAKDPQQGVEIPADVDVAGVRRRALKGLVYKVIDESGKTVQYVLPIRGMGLWGTLWGFLAVDADLNTVRGLGYYEHKETPGLGGEVDNDRWKGQWPGKVLRDAGGEIKIEVVKGVVDTSRPEAVHQVDGLAGATITSRGVTNMLRYWLGPHGYEPFLKQLASGS